MLVDPDFELYNSEFKILLGRSYGDRRYCRLEQGIYQCVHFGFSHEFRNSKHELDFPRFEDDPSFPSYGVCDSLYQLLEKAPRSVFKSKTPYVISIIEICKEHQPPKGGWCWHVFNYIGNQSPQTEYLADDPLIERVFVYNIIQVY